MKPNKNKVFWERNVNPITMWKEYFYLTTDELKTERNKYLMQDARSDRKIKSGYISKK